MRFAMQQKISRAELDFLKEEGKKYAKSKMAQQLAHYLITNLDHLISESPDLETGGLKFLCEIELISEVERERIYKESKRIANKSAVAAMPKIIDDFGNEIENTRLTGKLRGAS